MKFNPGQVANPDGRPVGARNKLQTCFLNDLLERWEIDGKNALIIMAKEDPTRFVQACAALMPREVSMEIGSPLQGMSDQELADALDAVRRLKAEMVQPVIEIKKLPS